MGEKPDPTKIYGPIRDALAPVNPNDIWMPPDCGRIISNDGSRQIGTWGEGGYMPTREETVFGELLQGSQNRITPTNANPSEGSNQVNSLIAGTIAATAGIAGMYAVKPAVQKIVQKAEEQKQSMTATQQKTSLPKPVDLASIIRTINNSGKEQNLTGIETEIRENELHEKDEQGNQFDEYSNADMKKIFDDLSICLPDDTGMAIGDALIGNATNIIGHAGIYLGKWQNLPPDIQKEFEDIKPKKSVYLMPSEVDSYLVVDSYGEGGVQIRPLIGQFIVESKQGKLDWEGGRGGSISFPITGKQRKAIIRSALEAVRAQVKYEDSHFQLSTTFLGQTGWKGDKVDCISFVHKCYQSAEYEIDEIDTRIESFLNLLPFHSPKITLTVEKTRIRDRINFEELSNEADQIKRRKKQIRSHARTQNRN